jgi:hypothetical protein
MMRFTLPALALCCALVLAPAAALAACVNCYPAPTTPLAGSEVVVGNQGSATVDIAVTDIAKIAQTLPNTFTPTQTFNGTVNLDGTVNPPDGSTWTSSSLSGLSNVTLGPGKTLGWTSTALTLTASGAAGSSAAEWKEGSTPFFWVQDNASVPSVAVGGNVSASTAGYCYGSSESGCLWWGGFTTIAGGASSTYQLGNGTPNDQSGMLDLKVLNATGLVQLPDNGVGGTVDTISTTQAIFGGQSLTIGGQTSPTLSNGLFALWIDPSVTSIPGLTATAGHGAVFQANSHGGCTGAACPNYDMEFRSSSGFGLIYFQNGATNVVQIGETRVQPSATATNEGMSNIAQMSFEDVVGAGSVTGPSLLINTEQGSDWASFGECNTTVGDFCLRLGGTGNFGSPWDDQASQQPDLGIGGCLRLGTASGTSWEGGPGLTFHERLCDNAGVATFYNTAKSASMPIAVAFERQSAVTLSALNTADASPAIGDRATITDATSCTFMLAVTGGGSTKCPVVYTGSWVAG